MLVCVGGTKQWRRQEQYESTSPFGKFMAETITRMDLLVKILEIDEKLWQ